MARGGIYKTDVLRARDSLLAKGVNPSLDAIRIALGNTGSKTTIHRYLKEIEEEDGLKAPAQLPISASLQDLVGRLADRLREEAEAIVRDAQERSDAKIRERDSTIAQLREDAVHAATALQGTEQRLAAEIDALQASRQDGDSKAIEIAKLGATIVGLNARASDQDTRIASLEQKHRFAQEALEHFRAASKEQRDQELSRHQHEVNGLKLEVKQLQNDITGKNQQLLQLNRDSGALLARASHLEQECSVLRASMQEQQEELGNLRQSAVDLDALRAVRATEQEAHDALLSENTRLQAVVVAERSLREAAESEAMKTASRLEAFESILGQLKPPQ